MRRAATIVVLASATVLLSASTASAAKQWSGPKTLSDPNETVDFPELAMNGRGNAVAVWYEVEGDDLAMRSATRVPGRGWGPPATVGTADQPSGNNPPTLPDVAIDRRGNAIASWLQEDGDGNLRVVAAFQPRGASFGAPVTLSDAGQPAFDPQIAFDHRGGVSAVWVRFDGANTRIQTMVKPANERFGTVETLSPAGIDAGSPQVGMSDSGRTVAIWLQEPTTPPFNDQVLAARRGKQGGFRAPQTLSSQELDADDPNLAVSRKGAAMAAWTQSGTVGSSVGTAFAPESTPFGAAVAIQPDSGFAGLLPRVAMDRRGRTTLLWLQAPPEDEPGTRTILETTATPLGELGTEQVLQTSQNGLQEPALAVARAGNAVAAWVEIPPNPPNPLHAAARTRRGSAFGATGTLSPEGVSAAVPSLGASRKLAIAVWEVSTGDEGTAVIAQTYRRR